MTQPGESVIPDGATVRARGSLATVLGREWCDSCEREHIGIVFRGSRVVFLANPEDLELVE